MSDTRIMQSSTGTRTPAGLGVWLRAVALALARPLQGLRQRWPPKRPTAFALTAAAVSVWAAVANLSRLGFPSVGFDEPLYAVAGWRYVHGDARPPPTGLLSNFDNFEHPPLAKYLFGLAELVAGRPSVPADRLVAALCTLASAAILGWWLGHVAGRWVGLGAAALVAVLPMSVGTLAFRFGRYGYLDPVAELFAVCSVALAWLWFSRHDRGSWWLALATGVSVGLATASKENGFLGAVGPVMVGLVLSARQGQMLERLVQTLLAASGACLVFVATYVGLANPVSAVRFLVRFQENHAHLGHPVSFAGRVTDHTPGWTFLWFAAHGIGLWVSLACLICAAAAIALRHDLVVLWCVAALAGPLIFHMALAGVVLSFYWVMWMPTFLALVALGVAELAKLPGRLPARLRGRPPARLRGRPPAKLPGRLPARANSARLLAVGPVLALGCVAALSAASVQDTYRTLTLAAPRQDSYATEVLARSPLLYWRLGERLGTTLADSSGNGHPGSYSGDPRIGAPGLLTGDPNRAVRFSGSGQFASVAGGSWLDAPDYTVAVWFSTSSASRYLVARDDYVTKIWSLQLDAGGHLRFLTYASFGGRGQPVDSRDAYNDGRRHLAVAIKQGSSMLLYVDGQLAGSASWQTYARSAGVGIDLARRGNGGGSFAGTLDEFAFFDTALSADDVVALYDVGTSPGERH